MPVKIKNEDQHESEDPVPRVDRRSKTKMVTTGAVSGVGSVGIGMLILNMLTQQGTMLTQLGNTQNDHSRWIKENSKNQQEVKELLTNMRTQFSIDISTFKLRHAQLEKDVGKVSINQDELLSRLTEVERDLVTQKELGQIEQSLKEWASDRFVPRKDK